MFENKDLSAARSTSKGLLSLARTQTIKNFITTMLPEYELSKDYDKALAIRVAMYELSSSYNARDKKLVAPELQKLDDELKDISSRARSEICRIAAGIGALKTLEYRFQQIAAGHGKVRWHAFGNVETLERSRRHCRQVGHCCGAPSQGHRPPP